MARLAGKICKFQIAGAEVLGTGSYTVDTKGDAIDVSGTDSAGNEEYIAGFAGWSMSFDGSADGAANGLITGAGGLRPGATCVVKPYIDAAKFYTGSAICTGFSVKMDVKGALTWSATFQGTGVLTYPV